MKFFHLFLAKFLDPISFILSIFGILFAKKKRYILPVGIVVALIVEGILAFRYGRGFGRGLIWGIPASIIHAYISYILIRVVK